MSKHVIADDIHPYDTYIYIKRWMGPIQSGYADKVKELVISKESLTKAFIPYFTMNVVVDSEFSALVGFDHEEEEEYYNSTTKEYDTRTTIVTDWYGPYYGDFDDKVYSHNNKIVQIYGGLKYPHQLVENAMSGDYISNSYDDDIQPQRKCSLSNENDEKPVIHPFELKENTARNILFDRIIANEKSDAEEWLLKAHSGDHVSDLKVHCTFSEVQINSFFLPIFIFNQSKGLSTYVNGFNGKIEGLVEYSVLKVMAAATPFVGVGTLLLRGMFLTVSPLVMVASFVTPVLLSGFIARYYPSLKAEEYEQWIDTRTKQNEKVDATDDDKERMKSYESSSLNVFEYELQVLGFPSDTTDISEKELKIAFNKLAQLYHPDHHHHRKEDKEKVTKKFMEIRKAYKTLLAFKINGTK